MFLLQRVGSVYAKPVTARSKRTSGIIRHSVGVCTFAAASLLFGFSVFAQDSVPTQPRVVDSTPASKTILTMQDGTKLSCDMVNGAPTNCAPIQAEQPAPVVQQQPVYPIVTVNNPDGSAMRCENVNGTITNCVTVQPPPQQQVVYTQPQQQPQVVYTQPAQQQQPQVVYAQPAQQVIVVQNNDPFANIASGSFFISGEAGYGHVFWVGMKKLRSDLDSNSFGNGFYFDLTLGYEWKYFGFYTALDLMYGWATKDGALTLGDYKGREYKEEGSNEVYKIKDFSDTGLFLNWSAGFFARYETPSVDFKFFYGMGVFHVNTYYEYKLEDNHYDFETMTEVSGTKTVSGDGDGIDKGGINDLDFFSLKFKLELDFRVTEHFAIGPSFGWIYVVSGSNDDVKSGYDMHVLQAGLNFAYTF